jgi:hypothetical protein
MSHTAYVDEWRELFTLSDAMNIAVGYASNNSLHEPATLDARMSVSQAIGRLVQ